MEQKEQKIVYPFLVIQSAFFSGFGYLAGGLPGLAIGVIMSACIVSLFFRESN